jgi:hypothetical protein
MPHGSGVGEPTANGAEQAAQLSKDCELIERTAKEINTEIAEHLLLAVTQDFTWRYLHMLRGLKTGEKKFCYLRRKFFNLLAKKKGMV